MRELLNTLYVQTPGTWIGLDHDCVLARAEDEPPKRVPLRRLQGICVFGPIGVSAALIQRCGRDGVALAWFTSTGHFTASLRSPTTGSVLLRRAQHQAHDDGDRRIELARTIVAGKLLNAARFARHAARLANRDAAQGLRESAAMMDGARVTLPDATDLDTVRGIEGQAGKLHFANVRRALKCDLELGTRSRRPPLSPVNALLSFAYGMGRTRIEHAIDGVGLDPQVGFLHALRPGRPSLALDLLEEHRPVLDRFIVTMLNRRQLDTRSFDRQEGGAVFLNEKGRRAVIESWSALLEREVRHRVMREAIPYGLVPAVQATIMARALRGDLPAYLPYAVEAD
jgi:CRISPR-associated protein Cas1